jgi:2-oxoisovalerate dehydrogenase E1 component beta subunit
MLQPRILHRFFMSILKTYPRCARTLAIRYNVAIRNNSTVVEPPPAGGHLPSVSSSKVLLSKRDVALRTPGIAWINGGVSPPSNDILGGRETRKMNMYQALRDAMAIALTKDERAIVFGQDVAFGGVFRCTMVSSILIL